VRSSDGAPFIRHPLEVATVLYRTGAPDHLIAAGLLHDVVEKTGVSAAELRESFGAHIAALVLAVSEDESISDYATRKVSLRAQVATAGAQVATGVLSEGDIAPKGERAREDLSDTGSLDVRDAQRACRCGCSVCRDLGTADEPPRPRARP
jgi:hypothetical protein